MLKEFKEFISRGNVVDLAVGVIIGAAFGKIVSSLVDNIIMPIVGVIIGGHDFSSLAITIKDAQIMYGAFIQSVIDFLINAVCLFIIVKVVNKFNNNLHKLGKKGKEDAKEEERAEEVVEEVKDQNTILLEEIRDLLKKDVKKSNK